MRTPDEIKKGLECYIAHNTGECEDIACRDCPHYDPNSAYTITACKDALAYIQQLEEGIDRCYKLAKKVEVALPKWISVEDGLPNEEVLAANFAPGTYGYKEYIIGYVCPQRDTEPGGCYAENDHEILRDVTHWMPLPSAPEVK